MPFCRAFRRFLRAALLEGMLTPCWSRCFLSTTANGFFHETDRKTDRARVKRIEVYKESKQVLAYGDDGKLVAMYPASIGSDERPAPRGTQEVKGVASEPKYTYNPNYKFKDVKSIRPFTIAPGPNNPVGSVWIDLSEDGYGIHGTPEPAEVGKTASHGCVRLTNWDARSLSEIVRPGVKVEFIEDK